MKVVINPTKPLYINEKIKTIRCGNFPETGKELKYEDTIFLNFFKEMSQLIDLKDLKKLSKEKYSIAEKDFDDVVDYLLKEKIIINDVDYNKIYKSKLYNRQNAFFYMTSNEFKETARFKEKNILILGLGGIGSNVAEQLARAGFCKFTLIDFDKVENSNLIRQNAYYLEDIGKKKTIALSDRLKRINVKVKTKCIDIKINSEDDVDKYIYDADFVVCTLDKPLRKIRRIINNVCIKYDRPVIFSGFAEHVGMIGPFVVPHKTACLNCIDKKIEEEPFQNVIIAPSFGPICNFISSIVSNETINYFLKYTSNNLQGCTLMFNMLTYESQMIKWERKENCKKCGDKK